MWKWSEGELWGNLILTDSQRDHHVCCSFTSISFSPISPSHTTMPFSLSFFILHNHNRHKERKIPDAILKHLCGVNERVSETQSKWIQGEWESIFFFISPAIVECGGSYLQPFCGCSKCGWFSKKRIEIHVPYPNSHSKNFYCCCHAPHSGSFFFFPHLILFPKDKTNFSFVFFFVCLILTGWGMKAHKNLFSFLFFFCGSMRGTQICVWV